PDLFAKALKSKSPRVRRAIFAALATILQKEKPEGLLTKEILDLMIQSLKSSEESWYVKDAALIVVGVADAEWVVPYVDLLISFLKHEEAWLRSGALSALTPIVAHPDTYEKVIPAVGHLIRTNQRASVTLGMRSTLRARINEAGPEVQMLAKEILTEAYTSYEGKNEAPGGQDISSTVDQHLDYIAGSLADVPGGLDVLYEIARKRYPNEILPYKDYFLNADPKQFGPELKNAIKPIINDELIPAYVGKNRRKLKPAAALEVQSSFPGGPREVIDGLTNLHDRAGDTSYNWKMFANIRLAEWWYHSFDPIPSEQVPFDNVVDRYRKVTLPSGMENWNQPDFDPASVGWRTGKAPFGNYLGKLPQGKVSKCLKSYSNDCTGPYCFGALPDNTLWEKEVLLLRQTFKVSPLKDGHRYRIRVNGGDHVGTGGGYGIWINGKQLIENPKGTGRGGGEKPKGAFVTKEFLDEFKGGKVTIAVKSFIRYNDKYKTKPTKKEPQGRISLHIEEQKLPPMGDDLVRKSATVVPMMSSEWQVKYDKENPQQSPDDNKFRWEGKFLPNKNVLGTWKVITDVEEINAFDPNKKIRKARRPVFMQIELKKDGMTNQPTWIWSGDHLMDLEKYQALRMRVNSIAGNEYLFIENGGFSTRNKPDWKSTWLVLTR
ncbi:MAG: HEAT repeat domain-containing protein, partial [Akkermansiaceae bacterium]